MTRVHPPSHPRPPLTACIIQDPLVNHSCAGSQLWLPRGVQVGGYIWPSSRESACQPHFFRIFCSFTTSEGGCTAWLGHQHVVGVWEEGLYFPGTGDSASVVIKISGAGQSYLSVVKETPTLALLSEGHSTGSCDFIFLSCHSVTIGRGLVISLWLC